MKTEKQAGSKTPPPAGVGTLQREPRPGLGVWELVLMALGSVVGGSFFLGTAIILREAGPATVIAFAVGAVLSLLILRALAELTVRSPAHGSFREYAEQAFGPGAGFVVGWVYWTGMMLAMSSEATAVAIFLRLWTPGLPIWLLSGTVIVLVTVLNLLAPGLFGKLESLMAGIKIGAIVLFILIGLALVVGLLPGAGARGLAAVRAEPVLPGGLAGVLGSMLLVMFCYAGFEVLGLAAPDARDPERMVPRAINLTTLLLVLLFMGVAVLLVLLLPLGLISMDVAPTVAALNYRGWRLAASGLNLVVMSASLSTMLAAIYGLGRMLQSLAEERQAPAIFGRVSKDGVPRPALLLSGVGMLTGSVLAYVLPKQVYLFLASSGGFSLLFAYLAIMMSQVRLRSRAGCPTGGCLMPGYPVSAWGGIAALVVIIVSMPLIPGQGAGLYAGLGLVATFSLAYLVLARSRRRQGPPAERRRAGWSEEPPRESVHARGPLDPEGPLRTP